MRATKEIFLHPQRRNKVAVKMLYLVGLGLSDETDITVKGLEVAKTASRVYLEAYTSILLVDQSVLVKHSRRQHTSLGANADSQ